MLQYYVKLPLPLGGTLGIPFSLIQWFHLRWRLRGRCLPSHLALKSYGSNCLVITSHRQLGTLWLVLGKAIAWQPNISIKLYTSSCLTLTTNWLLTKTLERELCKAPIQRGVCTALYREDSVNHLKKGASEKPLIDRDLCKAPIKLHRDGPLQSPFTERALSTTYRKGPLQSPYRQGPLQSSYQTIQRRVFAKPPYRESFVNLLYRRALQSP